MHAFFAPLLALIFLAPGGGWLGVYLAGDQERAVVTEVMPGSPAQKAGLQAGDVLISVGKTKTPSRDALIAAIGQASPGERVKLGVMRRGKSTVVVVKLGKRPSETAVAETAKPARARAAQKGAPIGEIIVKAEQAKRAEHGEQAKHGDHGDHGEQGEHGEHGEQGEQSKPYLGISVADTARGVAIDRILEHSPAAKSELRKGDIVISIGNSRVKSLDGLDQALSGMRVGKVLQVQVERGNERHLVSVVPGTQGKPNAVRPPAGAEHGHEAQPGQVRVRFRDPNPGAAVEHVIEVIEIEIEEPHAAERVATERVVEVVEEVTEEVPPRVAARQGAKVEAEIEALRAELKALKRQLSELKKELRRQGR